MVWFSCTYMPYILRIIYICMHTSKFLFPWLNQHITIENPLYDITIISLYRPPMVTWLLLPLGLVNLVGLAHYVVILSRYAHIDSEVFVIDPFYSWNSNMIIKVEKLVKYDFQISHIWWLCNHTFANIDNPLNLHFSCGDLNTINSVFE